VLQKDSVGGGGEDLAFAVSLRERSFGEVMETRSQATRDQELKTCRQQEAEAVSSTYST
jgi:hypothetical protein